MKQKYANAEGRRQPLDPQGGDLRRMSRLLAGVLFSTCAIVWTVRVRCASYITSGAYKQTISENWSCPCSLTVKSCRLIWQYAIRAVMQQRAEKRRWRSGDLLDEWLHRKHSYLEVYQQHILNAKSHRGKAQVSFTFLECNLLQKPMEIIERRLL